MIITDSNASVVNTDGGGIAKGNDALTILDNTETRNQFLDEMMEVNIIPETIYKVIISDSVHLVFVLQTVNAYHENAINTKCS